MGRGRSGKREYAPTNQGEIFGGEIGYFTQNGISELEALGARRWTKGGKDRLYLGGMAESAGGLEVDRYKSGNISSASINGERISNTEALKALTLISDAYVNLSTGGIVIHPESYSRVEAYHKLRSNIIEAVVARRYKKKRG